MLPGEEAGPRPSLSPGLCAGLLEQQPMSVRQEEAGVAVAELLGKDVPSVCYR